MKLKVYQQGGGLIYTPFIPEQQSTASTTSRTKSSDSDEDAKLDPLDKELLGLMKDQNLLPSDIQMIYNRLIQFQRKTQSLSSLPGFGGSDSYRSVMPGMLQIMNLVSQAKYNKQADDEIVKQMVSENAGNEFALDGYGRMYIQDKDGKIKKINPSEFDSEKHLPLSNSQLLYLRERNPELAFDGDVFEDMRNMVGMTSVSKEIDRIIKEFGTEEGQRYLSKETAQIFSDLNNPDGAYKLTMKIPSSGLKQAWKTIYDQLPINMQNLLKIRSAVSGDTPETYISDIVLHNSSTTQNIDYDATMSKAAGYDTDPLKTEKEKAEQLTQNNYLQQIGTRRLYRTNAAIVPTASQISDTGVLSAVVYNAGMPVDKQMDGIGMMTLSNFRVKAEAAKAGDFSSVTFGNRILRDNEFDQIVYDGVSELNIAMLPYKHDPITGQITPDFGKLLAFNYIQKLIDENPNISETELAQMAQEQGYDLNSLGYDRNTNTINIPDTMPFITFSAYASKDSLNIPKSMKPFLEHLSNADGKQIMDKFETIINYGEINPTKNSRKLNDYNGPERWDLYHGNIYVPMTNAARAMLLSGIGEYVPKSDMTNYASRIIARELESDMVNYLQQTDPNYDKVSQLAQFK